MQSTNRIQRTDSKSTSTHGDLQIITPVTEPTEWVSSITYPHKPDEHYAYA